MTLPKVQVVVAPDLPPSADIFETGRHGASPSTNRARIKDLGFRTSTHIKMYGERFELVSDPFEDGECTAVDVITADNKTIRTLRLPKAILIGSSNRFLKKPS